MVPSSVSCCAGRKDSSPKWTIGEDVQNTIFVDSTAPANLQDTIFVDPAALEPSTALFSWVHQLLRRSRTLFLLICRPLGHSARFLEEYRYGTSPKGS